MKFYTKRPAKRGTAQIAWDYLSHTDKTPVEMWRAHLTYWCWVMKFTDGSHEDLDCLTPLSVIRKDLPGFPQLSENNT